MKTPRAIFVTDPICAWCWGTLPELLRARETLAGEVNFELLMAGLQVGTLRELPQYEIRRLKRLWLDVRKTTGQPFSGELPDDFIYHSELACRAVTVARMALGEEPFEFFHALQQAFYVDRENISAAETLGKLSEAHGISAETMSRRLNDDDVIAETRRGFESTKFLAAHALPSVVVDVGEGPKLLCGGYFTADYLVEAIRERNTATGEA